MKEIKWFLDRVGGFVLQDGEETYISSEEEAKTLYNLQDAGVSFTEKLKVHRGPKEDCAACEA